MLELKKVSKSYSVDSPVLSDISFKIEKGQFASFVGLSGSGKTTLLKIMAGLLDPTSGSVHFLNEQLEGPKDKLLPGHEEIKLVFQDFALKLNMTVEENLRYALLGYEENYKKERVEELIRICGLDHLRLRFPQELSGGQKQRVAFSRALATEPEMVLMDEPFSNLDPLTKHDLLRETRALAKKTNTTVVLVTHDTRDAMEAADEIFVLSKGSIVQRDTPKAIYQNPVNPEVARLFGLINVIEKTHAKKHFGMEDDCGLWVEDIHIDVEGTITGEVVEVIFAGGHHKLIVSVEDQLELLVMDDQKTFRTGNQIKLSANLTNLIRFS